MSFYCNSSIESIQSCACSCRTSCFYPCRPCCCCKKHVAKPLFKRRSRFGDIFKGQTPNLEDLNYYRKKKKSKKRNGTDNKGERSKKMRNKGTKSNGKNGTGGKDTKRRKKGEKGTRPKGQRELIVVGDYDPSKLEGFDGPDAGGGKGGGGKSGAKKGRPGHGGTAGGGFPAWGAGNGGEGAGGGGYPATGTNEGGYPGTSGAGYGGTGYGETGQSGAGQGGAGQGGAGQAGAGYSTGGAGYGGIGHGGDGYGQGTDQGWQSGDGGAPGLGQTKWGRQNNECRPNQLVKCPQTCTLKPKKCMLNQIGPCHEACLKGIPYNAPNTVNYLQMTLGNQPYTNTDGYLYCAQGGLKRGYAEQQNVAPNFIDPHKSWVAPPAPIQTTSCPTYPNVQKIPQYCSLYGMDRNLKNMQTTCGPQNQKPIFNSHQNFGYFSPNKSQYCSPQIQNAYGSIPYNLQSSLYNFNPLEMSCQPGGLQNYTNNPLYQQQNYFGIQQSPTVNPSYGWPIQSSTSPKIISGYIQGDGNQPFCPAVRSVTCKLCGRERKFVQTLYVKPNVDTIFTTKDVKTKCSQTIS